MRNIDIKETINYRKKIVELGLEFPNGVVLLPKSLENATTKKDLMHEAEYETVQKLFKSKGIETNSIQDPNEKIPKLINQSFEWAGPLILYTSTMLSQHPEIVTDSISTITNYLKKKLQGVPKGDDLVNLSISTETKSGKFKIIDYKGPVDGLKDLPDIVRATYEEKNG